MGEPAPPLPRHLVLVGMMGVGKTTVGRHLASALRRRLVDTDRHLEDTSGRSVAAWFADDGEAGFRAAETRVLLELLEDPVPSVLTAGGGVVCRSCNRRRLGADDTVVAWLQASPAFLASRLRQNPGAHRPLLHDDRHDERHDGRGDGGLDRTLRRLIAEREPWYAEVADVAVDVEPHGGQAGDAVARRLLAELRRAGWSVEAAAP